MKINAIIYRVSVLFNILSFAENLKAPAYQPLNIPNPQFIPSSLPFTATKTFRESNIKVPICNPNTEVVYDKAIAVTWSGINDHEFSVEAVDNAARVFGKAGMEVHNFFPITDKSYYGKSYRVALGDNKAGFSHDTKAEDFKNLIDDIKRQNKGKKVQINFFFSNHGAWSLAPEQNNYSIAGPLRESNGGTLYDQGLNQSMLAYMANELKEFDVRFISGSCFGANTDDLFQQSYLKARSEAALPEQACSCSTVLAAWNEEAIANGKRAWESQSLDNLTMGVDKNGDPIPTSFLQASFNAMKGTRLGWEDTVSKDIGAKNGGMTTSERLLYHDYLVRSDKMIQHSYSSGIEYSDVPRKGTDELTDSFFWLDRANLKEPTNPKYKDLYDKTKRQTEEFLKTLGLSTRVKSFLGLNEDPAKNKQEYQIDFEAVKKFLNRDTNEGYKSGGEVTENTTIISLGTINNQIQKTSSSASIYLKALYELDKQIKKDPSNNTIDVINPESMQKVRMNEVQLKTAYQNAQEKFNKVFDEEYHKAQTALVVIKRLGLMLDFLNNEQLPQKRKDLFAFYRGCELQPLIPKIREAARQPNFVDSRPTGSGGPVKGLNGREHNNKGVTN
jgi:hypothetical protein